MSAFTNKAAGITGGNSGIELPKIQEFRRQKAMDEPGQTPPTAATNPFLSGNFAPVEAEITCFDLEVHGRIPEGLDGRFLRIGPNPIGPVARTRPEPEAWRHTLLERALSHRGRHDGRPKCRAAAGANGQGRLHRVSAELGYVARGVPGWGIHSPFALMACGLVLHGVVMLAVMRRELGLCAGRN